MKILSSFLAFIYYLLAVMGLPYGSENKIFTPKIDFTVEERTDVFCPSDDVWVNGAEYPTLIQLENGTLLTTFEVFDKGNTEFRIMESTDKGKTWAEISSVVETLTPGLQAAWEPCLFELPEAVGEFEKSTVVLGGISLDDGCQSKTQLSIWTSKDCGKTWSETSIADSAGGTGDGIWEPWFVYEKGTLYCFYSDDSDPVHSQTIVYKSTTDLVNWSEKVPVVVFDNPNARPGMPVITKMGNGMYYLTFELLENDENKPCRYKTSESISEWNAADEGTEIIALCKRELHSSPVCLWIPDGGRNGTLMLTATYGNKGHNEIFISHDYGKTYSVMATPFEYDSSKRGFGYSPSMIYSEKDNAVCFENTVDYKDDLSKIQFVRLGIK